jgi:hypothetical protein
MRETLFRRRKKSLLLVKENVDKSTVREAIRIVEESLKGKVMGDVRENLLWGGGRKNIILLKRSQASPIRPDKGSVKVKSLGWL